MSDNERAALRLRLMSGATEMKELAKSLHGEWLGRGGTDDLLAYRIQEIREASRLMGEAVNALAD